LSWQHEGAIGALLNHPGIAVGMHELEELGKLGLRIKGRRGLSVDNQG